MAEELYFIKTNPTVAKINLYNRLCSEENSILHFLKEDSKDRLKTIKDKLKDSIDTLTQEELGIILSWFYDKYGSNSLSNSSEEVKMKLYIHGIEIFFEIPSAALVKKFQEILTKYNCHSQCHFNYIMNSKEFNDFLIYGIFYTGMLTLFLEKHDQKNNKGESISLVIDSLKPNYPSLYQYAETDFNSNLEDFKTYISQHPAEPDTAAIFDDFKELYDLTRFYKGTIIKLQNP
ncbi:hypothetical protein M2347_000480 [Chryseobacterium sp. H1D6B]|uniref:hypothetical protein n=1 Tax=Chryseobacterium sp. H1D6B TaxID=2940588 RepID=UPI0015C81EC7|nr:hypothetical protein [Chryseobacterium sp. H1D6B]MDH6250753.1 hypothetical protein [Chryseobacterium sp. H1D6B]